VQLSSGSHSFNFFVIGDPCKNGGSIPDSLKKDAPELECDGGKLKGATMSDAGHVIIGMLFDENSDGTCGNAGGEFETQVSQGCKERVHDVNKSGMGSIFIDLAKINPVHSPSGPSGKSPASGSGDSGSGDSGSDGSEEAKGPAQNVHGSALKLCSEDGMAMTGFTRTGTCTEKDDDQGSHHICIDISSMKENFCQQTEQPDWCDQKGTCAECSGDSCKEGSGKCPRKHWCVCQWAFAAYVKKQGCHNIEDVMCSATNKVAYDRYKKELAKDPLATADNAPISGALACLKQKCGLE